MVVNYRVREDMARETCRMVEERGADCTIVRADVSRWEDSTRLVREAVGFLGGLDVLVNNAGVLGPRIFAVMEPREWERVVAVNLLGAFNVTRAALEHMREGVIVNIASTLAFRPEAEASVYSASKAGLVAWSLGLARELAPRVRVIAVAPGGIDTDMAREWGDLEWVEDIPLKRLARPSEVAKAVVNAVENPYVTGDIITVSGGIL